MITIGYSTRFPNPMYQEYIQKTCMYKKIQIIEKVNNGEKSLSKVYNEILDESENDIVVLIHDDLEFDTKNWGDKVINIFNKNPEYGILGLAGTTQLPKSGMWWEDRTKMYGIVNHKNQGKKWESKYSPSLGNKLKNVVLVDGLFISINKKNIKERFDESVEGFHMYDVNFCVKNFLSDVKIGVTTEIRVTHLSVGMTNEIWEENRKIFVNKYESLLPLKVKINNGEKLNVLISCLLFREYTGSEMYVFELAKNLKKFNCDVTVVSTNIDGPLSKKAQKLGIKVKHISQTPGYKMGDGKFIVNTQNGPQISTPNQFYKIDEVHFDIIHCQHKPIVELMCSLYPTIDKISTIHSEVINLENPVKHPSIKKYIAIRPEIKDYIIKNFNIESELIEVIYNPIDNDKFNNIGIKNDGYTLFVGTIDYLRKKTLFDLVEYTKLQNKELWIVGKNQSDYLAELKSNNHVKYFDSTYDIEKFVKNCDETSGILLGRTTIEGWMCGKPGWIYNIDNFGNILNKNKFEVPYDLDKFNSMEVSNKIYKEIINILE